MTRSSVVNDGRDKTPDFIKKLCNEENMSTERLEEILEQSGSYQMSTYTIGEILDDDSGDDFDSDNGEVSPDSRYSESDAEFSVWTSRWGSYPDRTSVGLVMDFGGTATYRERKPWRVPDIAGVTYDPNHWTEVGIPEKWSDEHDVSWYSGSTDNKGTLIEVDLETERNWGIKVPVEGATVTMHETLELQDDTKARCWYHYHHTSAVVSTSLDITVNIGVIEIDWGAINGHTPWDVYAPIDPEV